MPTRAQLVEHLERLADEGCTIPCQANHRAGWVAEHRASQQAAASMCARCPALTSCRDYGLDNPREFGVYGGLTDPERQPKRGRPKKDTAA